MLPNDHTTDAFLKSLHTAGASVRLSDASRARMREALAAYADLHDVQPARATRFANAAVFFSYLPKRTRGFAMAAFALVVVVGGGSEVALTAEAAVPGDLLYPVKVSVNEPIAETFAVTPAAKAAFHAKLAEKRIDEAVSLADRGDLTPEVEADVATRIALQVDKADEAADALAESGDTAASLAVQDELAAHLALRAEAFKDDDAAMPMMAMSANDGHEPVPEDDADPASVRGVLRGKLLALARDRGDLAVAVAPVIDEAPSAEARVAIATKRSVVEDMEPAAPTAKMVAAEPVMATMMVQAFDAGTTSDELGTTTATTTDEDRGSDRFFRAIRAWLAPDHEDGEGEEPVE